MKNDIVGFRPSDKCKAKIEELLKEGLSKSEIMEEAVDYYYAMRKNQLTDDPVFHLMKSTINESVDQWMKEIMNALEGQRYDMQFVLGYLDMCLKGFGFDDDETSALMLMNRNSHFRKMLDQKIQIDIAENQTLDK